MLKILLTTQQDVLAIVDDMHFEQIVSELPDMLHSMRAQASLDGHAKFIWPT